MNSSVDLKRLAALTVRKRGTKGLREIATLIGVSVPTLSRIEKGNMPDLETFMKLCSWLEVSPSDFQIESGPRSTGTPLRTDENVCALLRADRTLPPETAKALDLLIRAAYRDAINEAIGDDEPSAT